MVTGGRAAELALAKKNEIDGCVDGSEMTGNYTEDILASDAYHLRDCLPKYTFEARNAMFERAVERSTLRGIVRDSIAIEPNKKSDRETPGPRATGEKTGGERKWRQRER